MKMHSKLFTALSVALLLQQPAFAETKPIGARDTHADEDTRDLGTHPEGREKHEDARERGHDDDHGKAVGHGEAKERANVLRLEEDKAKAAGVVVELVTRRPAPGTLVVPGEVKLDLYQSQIVTPRIRAMILARHATLGERVRKGQDLVTLFSVDMAQAQGDFIVAKAEWLRVQRLGKKVVSEKRYTETAIAFQQARARLLAYGLPQEQLGALNGSFGQGRPGEFRLLAEQDGMIIADDFQIGEVVEPGRPIYQLTKSESRWIEARINPDDATMVKRGDTARITAGARRFEGRVLRLHQRVDEKTRTLGVRIGVDDPEGRLKPGQFVDVTFRASAGTPVMAVPKGAAVRSPDGDWSVFVQTKPDTYAPVEVAVLRETPEMIVVDGLRSGTRVAVKGAFFLQSELAKGGFDIHNH